MSDNNPTIITLPHDAISDAKVTEKQAVDFHRYENELNSRDLVTFAETQAAMKKLVDVRTRVIQAGNRQVQKRMGKRAERDNLKHADGVATVSNYPDLKIMWKKKRKDLTLSLLLQVFTVVYPKPDDQWLHTTATSVMTETNLHIPSTSSGQFRNFVEEIIYKNCFKAQRKFTTMSRSDQAEIGLMARPNGAHPMDRHCTYQPKSSFFQYQHISGWLDLVKTDPMAERIWDACETGALKDDNPSVAWGVNWVVENNHFPEKADSPVNLSLSGSSDCGETNQVTVEQDAAPVQAPAQAPAPAPAPPLTRVTIGIAKKNHDVGDWDSLAKRCKTQNDDLSTLNDSAAATMRSQVKNNCVF